MNADCQRGADNSLAPDNGNFHAVAIAGQHHQRCQAFVQEIGEVNFLAGFVQDLMMRKFYWLQMRTHKVVL